MAKYKMTDRWVNSFRPEAGRVDVGDLLCPGLYLRASARGTKAWSAVIRVGDRVERVTLGRYPVVTLAAAREKALGLMRSVADGSREADRTARVAAGAEPPTQPALTFGGVIDAYVDHISKNARSWKLIASNLRRPEMQPLHTKKATAVTKGELVAVVDGLATSGTPHAAVSLLRHLKMAINFAVERDMLPANPLDKVRPPAKTTERERVLTDSELARVWVACGELPQPWTAMIRMLILTGCRRNEIARASHSEIEGDTLIIPGSRMKMGTPHAVPLVPEALAVLAPLRSEGASGFLFSTDGGVTASSNFAKVKAKLDGLSGVSDYVLHDFRRSVRTGLAALGVPREVARKVLNHNENKVDRIYARYDFIAERREALEKWATTLASLIRRSNQ